MAGSAKPDASLRRVVPLPAVQAAPVLVMNMKRVVVLEGLVEKAVAVIPGAAHLLANE
jgi:hypothetical protein